MSDFATVKDLLEKQGEAWEEFKRKNEARFKETERYIDEILKKMGRPGAAGSDGDRFEDDPERKAAIIEYLRKGPDAIKPETKAILAVGTDPSGGYFVHSPIATRIVERVFETSPVRQVAAVETIKSDRLPGVAAPNDDDAGWVGEEQTRDETNIGDFAAWDIPVHEMYAQPVISQKLLEDADIDLENWIVTRLGRRFARLENAGFVVGNGIVKPRGFTTYPVSTSDDATRAWGTLKYLPSGAAGAFAASNPTDALWDMALDLKAEYLANAVWMMRRSTFATISKFKDGQGNYLHSMGNVQGKPVFQLLGYPVLFAENMPAIAANSLSIAFGDFRSGYQIVDRVGISVLRDPYTTKGKVKLYSRKRVGGAVVDFDAIRLMKFAAS